MRKLYIAVALVVVMLVTSALAQEVMTEGYHVPSQFERSTALCTLFALKHLNLSVRVDPFVKREFIDNCMVAQGFAKDKTSP
jgi:hypothetical protein